MLTSNSREINNYMANKVLKLNQNLVYQINYGITDLTILCGAQDFIYDINVSLALKRWVQHQKKKDTTRCWSTILT